MTDRICALDECANSLAGMKHNARYCCRTHGKRDEKRKLRQDPAFRERMHRENRVYRERKRQPARRLRARRRLEQAAQGIGRPRHFVMGWCPICNEAFVALKKGPLVPKCCSRKCLNVDKDRALKARRKTIVRGIKITRGCERCGCHGPAEALHFHHLNPATKTAGVARLVAMNTSMLVIEAEIEKCIVLCQVCHAKEHTAAEQLTLA